jgi:hypothetical protein
MAEVYAFEYFAMHCATRVHAYALFSLGSRAHRRPNGGKRCVDAQGVTTLKSHVRIAAGEQSAIDALKLTGRPFRKCFRTIACAARRVPKAVAFSW